MPKKERKKERKKEKWPQREKMIKENSTKNKKKRKKEMKRKQKGRKKEVKKITWQEFELSYYDVAVQDGCHFATGVTSTYKDHNFQTSSHNPIWVEIPLKSIDWFSYITSIKSLKSPHIYVVGWVLWHINLCRLFSAKSIFIQIISSISNNSVNISMVCQFF